MDLASVLEAGTAIVAARGPLRRRIQRVGTSVFISLYDANGVLVRLFFRSTEPAPAAGVRRR